MAKRKKDDPPIQIEEVVSVEETELSPAFIVWKDKFLPLRGKLAIKIQEFSLNTGDHVFASLSNDIFKLRELIRVGKIENIGKQRETGQLSAFEEMVFSLEARLEKNSGKENYSESSTFNSLNDLVVNLNAKLIDIKFDPRNTLKDIGLEGKNKSDSAINTLRNSLNKAERLVLSIYPEGVPFSPSEAEERLFALEEVMEDFVLPARELLSSLEAKIVDLDNKAFEKWESEDLIKFPNYQSLLKALDKKLPNDNGPLPSIKRVLFGDTGSDGIHTLAKKETILSLGAELTSRKQEYFEVIWKRAESLLDLINVRIQLNNLSDLIKAVAGKVAIMSVSGNMAQLQETLLILRQSKDNVKGIADASQHSGEASLWVSELNDQFIEAEKTINNALEPLEEAKRKLEGSTDYRERQLTKASVEAFLSQRLDNAVRKEGQSLSEYLNIIHEKIIKIATITTWNGLLDKVSSPRTTSYEENPMAGPAKEFSLNATGFTYDLRHDLRVKSYESFFDLFFLYFDDDSEHAEVKEFCDLMKEKFKQISVWHNRAVVRRSEETPIGPEGALAAFKRLYNSSDYSPRVEDSFKLRENATPSEIRFVEGTEFSMAIWSTMVLKKRQREKIWNQIDPRVQAYFYGSNGDSEGKHKFSIKKEYRVVPRYKATDKLKKEMIEKIILDLKSMGLAEQEAQMAYHIGECYRIGGGIEAFLDASYKNELRPKNSEQSNVGVQAQEAEPKGANLGLYVESAWGNKSRPDFVAPFKDTMVHGYPPFSIAEQYNHSLPSDPSGFGDNRASLAMLLAIKGSVISMTKENWKTRSTNPDKTIYQAASQTISFLWPSSKISSASEMNRSFFVDVRKLPLQSNITLDRDDEWIRVAKLFGFQGDFQQRFISFMDKFSFKESLSGLEQYGFHAESHPLSGDRAQRLKALYKESRDYWINSFLGEASQNPQDVMRMMEFIFSRDDMDENSPDKIKYYVNGKIGKMIEQAKSVPSEERINYVNNQFKPWLQGYMNYDVLMRANFYLLSPDFRNIKGMSTPDGISKIYNSLNFGNFEDFVTTSISGGATVNTVQLMYVINQARLLLDLLPDETAKIESSGYRLFEDDSSLELVADSDRGRMVDTNSVREPIFTHADLLRLANEYGMGKGSEYKVAETSIGHEFWQLSRADETPTKQWVIDRIRLLQFLFSKDKLDLRS